MSWFKIDDKLWGHPKWMAVPKGGRALWVTAGSWAAANETDGRIPREALRALGGNAADAQSLVAAGLWREVRAGWIFHEWSIYQPDAASQKAKRRADAEAGALGNHKRWHTKRGINVPECEYCQGMPLEDEEPPPSDEEIYRQPDRVPDGPPDAFSIGSASPVPVPHSPSGSKVGGGGSVSTASASEPPPPPTPEILQTLTEPWRCTEHQGVDASCLRCKAYKAMHKSLEAERVKTEKADARAAELARRRAEREAEAATVEPVEPGQAARIIEKIRKQAEGEAS